MAAIVDFAHKFGLVLKACNLSRGQLAQSVGIDKSVVSRWASGVQAPTDHNLTLLTEVVGRYRPGFSRADWELASQAFAARLGLGGGSPASAPTLTLPKRPSIAVLAFANMSGDPEQEYFADGMAEDIITALSRFKSLFVMARNSSFIYKSKAVDIKQIGRELGVRYVLEGSVRKSAAKVRISAQLIDSETGAHLWADRFAGLLEDVFELQDQVTTSVVGAIAPKLEKAEMDRARRKPIDNLDAYDCFLRGMAEVHKQSKESWRVALKLFYRAIELDPDFSTPYAMAARSYQAFKFSDEDVDWNFAEAETRRLVARVSAIGQDDAPALCWAGHAMAAVCNDIPASAALIDQGLALNHNFAVGWQLRAIVSLWQGDYEAAQEQATRAMRLSPMDPEMFRSEHVMTLVAIYQGRYDDAVGWAKKVQLHHSSFLVGLYGAAVANALAGNIEEAREIARRILERNPSASISNFLANRPAGQARMVMQDQQFIEGLRLSGLPE